MKLKTQMRLLVWLRDFAKPLRRIALCGMILSIGASLMGIYAYRTYGHEGPLSREFVLILFVISKVSLLLSFAMKWAYLHYRPIVSSRAIREYYAAASGPSLSSRSTADAKPPASSASAGKKQKPKALGKSNPEEFLSDLKRPVIWFDLLEENEDAASRFGGLPALPDDIEWPVHTKTKTPLHFLGQLDLREMPITPLSTTGRYAHALPKSGTLFFFCDIDEEMCWGDSEETSKSASRVLFAETQGRLRPAPVGLPKVGHGFGALDGGHSHDKSPSIFPSRKVRAYIGDGFELEWSHFKGCDGAQQAAAFDLEQQWFRKSVRYASAKILNDDEIKRHLMLGPFMGSQGLSNSRGGPTKAGIVPLLQIQSDPRVHPEFNFGDAGEVCFWIDAVDLATGKFEKAWADAAGG